MQFGFGLTRFFKWNTRILFRIKIDIRGMIVFYFSIILLNFGSVLDLNFDFFFVLSWIRVKELWGILVGSQVDTGKKKKNVCGRINLQLGLSLRFDIKLNLKFETSVIHPVQNPIAGRKRSIILCVLWKLSWNTLEMKSKNFINTFWQDMKY